MEVNKSVKEVLSCDELLRKYPRCCDYVIKHISGSTKSCIVPAPVKSGKRMMVIYRAASCGTLSGPQRRKIVYLSALSRVDNQVQLEELERYKVEIILVTRKSSVKKALERLDELAKEAELEIHFDESDYGTGSDDKNLLKDVYAGIMDRKLRLICYSATNEEAMFSSFAENYAEVLPEYDPSEGYRGSKWFLDNNLVFRAEEFYDREKKELTPHGKEVCEYWKSTDKPISLVRITRNLTELANDNAFKTELLKYDVTPIFIDAKRRFDWSRTAKDGSAGPYAYYVQLYKQKKLRTLLVICQTCSRSTEVGFHEEIAFWHDYRKDSDYNTMLQAFLRIAHYDDKKNKNAIRLYCTPEVLQYDAKVIDELQLNAAGIKLSGRISSGGEKKKWKAEVFDLESSARTRAAIVYQCLPEDVNHYRLSQIGRSAKQMDDLHNICEDIMQGTVRLHSKKRFIELDTPYLPEHLPAYKEFTEKRFPQSAGKYLVTVPDRIEKVQPKSNAQSMFSGAK